MDTLLTLFLILIALALIFGLLIVLTIYITKKLRNTRFKKFMFLIPTIIGGFVAFEIYVAVYPSDSFYKDDFEYITKIKLPSSAKILSKDVIYPDIHGHYASVAVVKLSSTDYKQLLNKINADLTFKVDSTISENSVMYKNVTDGIEQNQINKIVRKGKMKIGFLIDNRRIILKRQLSEYY